MIEILLFIGVCFLFYWVISGFADGVEKSREVREKRERAIEWLGVLEPGTPADAWVPPGGLKEAFDQRATIINGKQTHIFEVRGAPAWQFRVVDGQVDTVQTGMSRLAREEGNSATF